jgi:hypothetical protein
LLTQAKFISNLKSGCWDCPTNTSWLQLSFQASHRWLLGATYTTSHLVYNMAIYIAKLLMDHFPILCGGVHCTQQMRQAKAKAGGVGEKSNTCRPRGTRGFARSSFCRPSFQGCSQHQTTLLISSRSNTYQKRIYSLASCHIVMSGLAIVTGNTDLRFIGWYNATGTCKTMKCW